jgi:hypothetical protein
MWQAIQCELDEPFVLYVASRWRGRTLRYEPAWRRIVLADLVGEDGEVILGEDDAIVVKLAPPSEHRYRRWCVVLRSDPKNVRPLYAHPDRTADEVRAVVAKYVAEPFEITP